MKLATVTVAALTALSCLGLAACQNQEPQANKSFVSQQPVQILLDPNSMEQRVVAEIYKLTLEEDGRNVNLMQDPQLTPERRVETVMNGVANMWIGCTGTLLESFDPNRAHEISDEYVADEENPSGVDFLAETHIALMAALPTDLTTVDPSSAQGCESEDSVELPQFFVPVYVKELLDRDERMTVASLTKFLTTDDITELVEEAEATGNVHKVVAEWMNQNNTSGEINSNSDSDSSDNSDS